MPATDEGGARPGDVPELRSRAARALARHRPQLVAADLRYLGGGLDHAAFLVGDLVLRVVVGGDQVEVEREAALLRLIAGRLSLPVPAPVFSDPGEGVLAQTALPGRPLLGREPPDGAAAQFGRFLRELHAVDPDAVGDLVPVDPADADEWLDDLEGPEPLLEVLRDTAPGPAGALVLAHADLGAEHLLEHGGRLSGVLDWTDAAVTDPALDLARPYRDFGPEFLDEVLRAYGEDVPVRRERITFFARCAALEDLAFADRTGRAAYGDAARRSLRWLFPGVDVGGPGTGRGRCGGRARGVPGPCRTGGRLSGVTGRLLLTGPR